MKKILLLSFLFMFTYSQAQDRIPTVEKSLYGVQLGTLSLTGFYEGRLATNWTLKGQLGLVGNLSIYTNDTDFYMQPQIALEPRFYYNLKKRNEKGKNTANNSGNYIALATSYRTDWFGIFTEKDQEPSESLQTYLAWGLRRSYGEHFHLEFATGLGYYKELNLDEWKQDDSAVAIYLNFKIGYQF